MVAVVRASDDSGIKSLLVVPRSNALNPATDDFDDDLSGDVLAGPKDDNVVEEESSGADAAPRWVM